MASTERPNQNQSPDPTTPDGPTSEGNAQEKGTEQVESTGQENGTAPNLRLPLITLAAAIAIAVIAQVLAPSFDHQNANLIGLACCGIATIYLLFSVHRILRQKGRSAWVPAGIIVSLLCFAILFRFEGFSGEMMPIFQFRFSQERSHELKTVAIADTSTPDTENQLAENQLTEPNEIVSAEPWNQFLGPDRTAVIDKRAFSVPSSTDQVRIAWDQGIGQGWSSFAISDNQAITLEQRDGEECLSCYRLTDGALLWIRKHTALHTNGLGGPGPRSTPTIDGDRVFASSATGHIWCVNRFDGEIVWEIDVLGLANWNQEEFEQAAPWGYACSPLIIDDMCILSLGGPIDGEQSASLVTLDKTSGAVRWKSGDDQLSYASPIRLRFDGVDQIVSVNEKTVSGHSLDGKQLWDFSWPGSTNTGATCSSAVPVGNDRLLVGKGYGGGSALVKIQRSESQWIAEDIWRSHRVLKTKFNHTCVDDEVGYGISNGSLQAVDLRDATPYWTQPRRSRVAQGQVILVEDTLVVQSESGEVLFVDATTADYQERLRLPALSSKTWNIPSVFGRYVIVRNDRQAICFELPAR